MSVGSHHINSYFSSTPRKQGLGLVELDASQRISLVRCIKAANKQPCLKLLLSRSLVSNVYHVDWSKTVWQSAALRPVRNMARSGIVAEGNGCMISLGLPISMPMHLGTTVSACDYKRIRKTIRAP